MGSDICLNKQHMKHTNYYVMNCKGLTIIQQRSSFLPKGLCLSEVGAYSVVAVSP